MRSQTILSLLLALGLTASLTACSQTSTDAVEIQLSDQEITVDGSPVSTDPTQAVHTGADIIYYPEGTDETYGEGSPEEMHPAEEADAHRVVTITQPGSYRLSGTLSQGQIAVDLGKEAKDDPEAVVTLILDNADVTCTVAPALIFYNAYECGEADEASAGPNVDTSAAGANVVIAAGSENHFTGSHVARIYKEGTTDKLHKYDGAFYSKVSMNIWGDNGDDSGTLSIVGDNEGLNSELHLTIQGGSINIQSQDDGINTNEDNISVTTINGGHLSVNAGLGAEGDGIDSNGYLTINGGTVWTASNPQTPDGGIDADRAITINGGTLSAYGTRNDAVDSSSAQPYMELSFASSLPAGSQVKVANQEGSILWSGQTEKVCQAITLTSPDLTLDTPYQVYVDDVLQRWNSAGMGGMGQPPAGMDFQNMPEEFDPSQMPEGFDPSQMEGQPPEMPENFDPSQMQGQPPEMPENFDPSQMEGREMPENFDPGQRGGRGDMGGQIPDGSGSTDFTLTPGAMSFSGVCDSDGAGKTRVTFTLVGLEGFGQESLLPAVTAITPSQDLDLSLVQITVTDSPSEDYARSCLLSDGLDAVNGLLPEDPGSYTLTIAVVADAEGLTGATQIAFQVTE